MARARRISTPAWVKPEAVKLAERLYRINPHLTRLQVNDVAELEFDAIMERKHIIHDSWASWRNRFTDEAISVYQKKSEGDRSWLTAW